MITFYSWGTPNPLKVKILLEELGLPYEEQAIDPLSPAVTSPEVLAVSPNAKIPAIVDPEVEGEPLSLFESGAILLYLAEKTGSALLPDEPRVRAKTQQWLMWQMAGIGPMIGQYFHFNQLAPEKLPYAIERYLKEMHRLLQVLEDQLTKTPFVAGHAYTIADIAIYAWVAMLPRVMGVELEPSPEVRRWLKAIDARPAVQRAMPKADAA